MPPDLQEAIASLIYAAKRCSSEAPELAALRGLFGARYGPEFIKACSEDETAPAQLVGTRLMQYLSAVPPAPHIKLAMLVRPRIG